MRRSLLAALLFCAGPAAAAARDDLYAAAGAGPALVISVPTLRINPFLNHSHYRMTKNALKEIQNPDGSLKFNAVAADDIAFFSDRLDVVVALGQRPYLPQAHFDDDLLENGLAYIEDQFEAIADPKRTKNVRAAQERFGWILHAIQDFYSHSDYVEAWVRAQNPGVEVFARMTVEPAEIPVWDRKRLTLGQALTSGAYPKPRPGFMTHDELNKDRADSPRGRVRTQDGASLYQLARLAAEKGTLSMVPEFENAIRQNPVFKNKNPVTDYDRDSPPPNYP